MAVVFTKMQIKNLKSKILNHNRGFIFLEIIIAVALISIVFMTLLGIGFLSLNISASIQKINQAGFFIKEEFEAVRSFRDGTTWANFKNVNFGSSNPYYFTLSSNQWTRNLGTETLGIFTRNVIFDQVYRDSNENIASSGTLDNDTIKVTVTINWSGKTLQTITYLTNWQKQ